MISGRWAGTAIVGWALGLAVLSPAWLGADAPHGSTPAPAQRPGFEVQFRYQMEERDGGFSFFCSQKCLEKSQVAGDGGAAAATCDACAKRFTPDLVSQVLYLGGRRRYACSLGCRSQLVRESNWHRRFFHPVALLTCGGIKTSTVCFSRTVAKGLPETMSASLPGLPTASMWCTAASLPSA